MANSEAEELLIGAEIAAIDFIRDDVQVQLENTGRSLGLTFIDDPVVLHGGGSTTRSMPGWRDQLCRLIGQTIDIARIDEQRLLLGIGGERLEVRFAHEFGPESTLLLAGDDVWVW